MDEEQMAALTASLMDSIDEKFKSLGQPVTPAAAPVEPVTPAAPVEPVTPVVSQGVSAESLVAEMAKLMSTQQDSKAFDVMFNNELDRAKSSNPGFQEYLDGTDDYGDKRLDKISEGTYEEKVNRLKSMENSFVQAQTTDHGRTPAVSQKVQERVKETQAKYDEIDQKLLDGEYATPADMAQAYFNVLDVEIAGLE